MSDYILKYAEAVFRNSNDNDDLFDVFELVLSEKIKDVDLYKILLGNPALSQDEVIMYTEKLCKEISDSVYDLCMWTANIFGNKLTEYNCIETSISYLKKASLADPQNCAPYLTAINLFDLELNLPVNNKIIKMVEEGVSAVAKKSKVYYSLADLYKKNGNQKLAIKYSRLAEKAALREDQ